jgi:hypothetical protein
MSSLYASPPQHHADPAKRAWTPGPKCGLDSAAAADNSGDWERVLEAAAARQEAEEKCGGAPDIHSAVIDTAAERAEVSYDENYTDDDDADEGRAEAPRSAAASPNESLFSDTAARTESHKNLFSNATPVESVREKASPHNKSLFALMLDNGDSDDAAHTAGVGIKDAERPRESFYRTRDAAADDGDDDDGDGDLDTASHQPQLLRMAARVRQLQRVVEHNR